MEKLKNLHRMVETMGGEVCLRPKDDYCEAYVGDNYDDYLCDVDCSIYDDEDYIIAKLNDAMMY